MAFGMFLLVVGELDMEARASHRTVKSSQLLMVVVGSKPDRAFCFLVSKLCAWLPRSPHYKKCRLEKKLLTRYIDR